MDFKNPKSVLDLANIRDVLVRMEDTIVFSFIERSQFFLSKACYKEDQFPIPDFHGSFLDWLLLQREMTESLVRRFESPDETPFFPDKIQKSFLPSLNYPKILASYSAEVNFNDKIKQVYVDDIVPNICAGPKEQPENYGSTVLTDIDCLQALSRRIHFGKFVAEAKYQSDKPKYIKMIKEKDIKSIEEAITNEAVEAKILERLLEKGRAFGTDPTMRYNNNVPVPSKVKPEELVRIYKEFVIPLTKVVEVDYLLRRLEDEPEINDDELEKSGEYVDKFLSTAYY